MGFIVRNCQLYFQFGSRHDCGLKTGKLVAMSGYLEVKYPFKSNLVLNPFKSWKRQWCILRPSPTFSGGILAVYCSEAGATVGTIELPSGCVVRRTKSRTRPHAFAVFPADETRKPRVLLAASTLHDATVWMEKIKALLINGNKLLDTEGSLKDSYSVTIQSTELTHKCGLTSADSTVSVTSNGVLIARQQKPGVFIQWKHVRDASLATENGGRNETCILTVDSEFHGGGELQLSSPLASALASALRRALAGGAARCLSRSDGDLRKAGDTDIGDVRRSSWYSGPCEVSLDDLDLIMSKDSKRLLSGQLSRCSGAGHLAAAAAPRSAASLDDSMCDRRSLLSVASGIYEEILDVPAAERPGEEGLYCKMSRDRPLGVLKLKGIEACIRLEEPTYESVAECVHATLRRSRRPPPLPPRLRTPDTKPTWREAEPAGGRAAVTRHGSLGCLPPAPPAPPAPGAHAAKTLPRWDRSRHAFSAFRKRLKSDSRIAGSPKSETAKDRDVETKKKKFDFTPTRDIFKSFKVSRKMKNLKISSTNLTKGETKSCEFLDDTQRVSQGVKSNRCSKSVECLEGNDEFLDEFGADLSIEFDDDTVAALSLPQEIVQLILKEHEKLTQMCAKDEIEGDYMPMSPVAPPVPVEHHYIVMSPRTNMA